MRIQPCTTPLPAEPRRVSWRVAPRESIFTKRPLRGVIPITAGVATDFARHAVDTGEGTMTATATRSCDRNYT